MQTNYYAVIFTTTLTEDLDGYHEMATKIEELAKQQPGYLGISSARGAIGITVSYWKTEQAIINWKEQVDHQLARKLGRERWYASYKVEVARVERSYQFEKNN